MLPYVPWNTEFYHKSKDALANCAQSCNGCPRMILFALWKRF